MSKIDCEEVWTTAPDDIEYDFEPGPVDIGMQDLTDSSTSFILVRYIVGFIMYISQDGV